jgi:molybdopterin converting factor small subunit
MARVTFTANLSRHLSCPAVEAEGGTVREVLDRVFAENQQARSYVLDDQAALRKHMAVFVNGNQIKDRAGLSDPVPPNGEIYVLQALSGG